MAAEWGPSRPMATSEPVSLAATDGRRSGRLRRPHVSRADRRREGGAIDVYVHLIPDTAPQLTRIESLLRRLLYQQGITMADLSALTAEVSANTDVTASASTLIQRLADEIAAAGTDQAALDALVEQLRANDGNLGAAVAANTPGDTGGGATT